MLAPDPKKAKELNTLFQERKKAEEEVEALRLKEQADIKNAAQIKAEKILSEAFDAAMNQQYFLKIDISESNPIDIQVKSILIDKACSLKSTEEMVKIQEDKIDFIKFKKENSISEYANQIHALRISLYHEIMMNCGDKAAGEDVAGKILPMLFKDLQPNTPETNWLHIKEKLSYWSNIYSIKPNDLKISTLTLNADEAIYIASKTNLTIPPTLPDIASSTVNCVQKIYDSNIQLQEEQITLNSYKSEQTGRFFLTWDEDEWIEHSEVDEKHSDHPSIDGNLLGWISYGDGPEVLKRLTEEVNKAANLGASAILLDETWFNKELFFAEPRELHTTLTRLGFTTSLSDQGFLISWDGINANP